MAEAKSEREGFKEELWKTISSFYFVNKVFFIFIGNKGIVFYMKDKIVRKVKCLLIYSGGLDSTLAVKVLESQGIDVTAINFVSYFFGSKTAEKTARENNIKLRIFDDERFKREHWELVQKPKYGHGSAINPCIDCHLLMFKWAGEIMKKVDPPLSSPIGEFGREVYDFVASGEVLGERPMSQNKKALLLIEKESGLKGYLLRPLSAKLLDPTIPEKEGLVDREKLLNLSGRGRTRQMELAKKYGLKFYPTPGGGCILTEKEFSNRLRDLMEKAGAENIKPVDLQLLKIGRHFWSEATIPPSAGFVSPNLALAEPSWYKIILGRDKGENEQLKNLAQKGDIFITPKNFIGPSALIKMAMSNTMYSELVQDEAKKLIIQYTQKDKLAQVLEFEIK